MGGVGGSQARGGAPSGKAGMPAVFTPEGGMVGMLPTAGSGNDLPGAAGVDSGTGQSGTGYGAGTVLELGGAPPDCVLSPVGAAGEQAVGGAPDLGECFKPVGAGLRCEGAEAHAQGPLLERACESTTLSACEELCRHRPDCTGVSDYFVGQQPYDLCYLRHAACGKPATSGWQEEDAGKEYVKVCSAQGCHLEYLGDWIRCDDETNAASVSVQTSLQDCATQCLQDPMCTSITDYFYLRSLPGCYLYTGTCSAPQPLPFEDLGKAYVRAPCAAN